MSWCDGCGHSMSWHKQATLINRGDQQVLEARLICLRASYRCGKPMRVPESRKKVTVPSPGQHPLAVTPERARAIQSELADKIWRT